MIWEQIALFVFSTVLSYYLRPDGPPPPQPAKLNELEVPTAEQGTVVPVVFGTRQIKSPNVVWFGDLKTTKIKKSGGKK